MNHEPGFIPPPEFSAPVGTLEALLRVHRDFQRGKLFLHIGDPLAERLAGFIEGYRACLREYGLPDEGYSRFCVWLWNTKGEEPLEKTPEHSLSKAGGNHEQAIGAYLDWVSEFSSLQGSEQDWPEAAPSTHPSVSEGRRPACRDTLFYLLQVRQDLLQGRIQEHLGDTNVERFNTFVDGYNACADDNHLKNELYARFGNWLRDVKREFPEEGWPAKYLRDCHGDHTRAILRYLDFAAEFAAQLPG